MCFWAVNYDARALSTGRRCIEELANPGPCRVDLDAAVMCADLTISEQYLIEIAKGTAAESTVIIYDEPTAALDAQASTSLRS